MPTSNDWETEDTPRISKRSIVVAAAVYAVWIAFLAALAAQRWLGGLQ